MATVREHLINKVAVSEVFEKYGLQLAAFYYWHKRLFEKGTRRFLSGRVARHRGRRRRRPAASRPSRTSDSNRMGPWPR